MTPNEFLNDERYARLCRVLRTRYLYSIDGDDVLALVAHFRPLVKVPLVTLLGALEDGGEDGVHRVIDIALNLHKAGIT